MTSITEQLAALKTECYHNKWHPTVAQCQKPGHALVGYIVTGNFTDDWTWCDEHAGVFTPAREVLAFIDEECKP